ASQDQAARCPAARSRPGAMPPRHSLPPPPPRNRPGSPIRPAIPRALSDDRQLTRYESYESFLCARYTHYNARTCTRLALNTNLSAQQLCPFAHTRQPKMSLTRNLVWIKPTPIILHHHLHVLLIQCQRQRNIARLPMFTRIRQSLLRHAIHPLLQAW